MFFITKLPLFSVIVFYVFCIISAILFPGTEKDIVGFKSFNVVNISELIDKSSLFEHEIINIKIIESIFFIVCGY